MRIRGPINISRLPIESQEFLAGLMARQERFRGFQWMAEEDDDDEKDKDKGDDADAGSADDDADKGKDDDEPITREEFERLQRRMKAADQRADAAERKVKEAEDAKKDSLTKAEERAAELEAEVTTLRGEVKTLNLRNAFLTANKHNWHDPDTALDLAERKGFLEDVMDEDGKVDKKALSKAMDRLAGDHKYLIKDDDKDDEPGGPSGDPAGRRSSNSKDDKAKKEELRKRFPILNR